MRHDPNSGCRSLWINVAFQALIEAQARLEVARTVEHGERHCIVLGASTIVRTEAYEMAKIAAYFRGPDWRMVCEWASLPCDPDRAIAWVRTPRRGDPRTRSTVIEMEAA